MVIFLNKRITKHLTCLATVLHHPQRKYRIDKYVLMLRIKQALFPSNFQDQRAFIRDFQSVFEKMLRNGYSEMGLEPFADSCNC